MVSGHHRLSSVKKHNYKEVSNYINRRDETIIMSKQAENSSLKRSDLICESEGLMSRGRELQRQAKGLHPVVDGRADWRVKRR